jgi:hypothetical protein
MFEAPRRSERLGYGLGFKPAPDDPSVMTTVKDLDTFINLAHLQKTADRSAKDGAGWYRRIPPPVLDESRG